MIRILDHTEADGIFTRRTVRLHEAEAIARPILEAISRDGDSALIDFARRFDGLPESRPLGVPQQELQQPELTGRQVDHRGASAHDMGRGIEGEVTSNEGGRPLWRTAPH